MPKLIITEKGGEKKQVVEFSHEGVSIGRSDENSVRLPSPVVSRKHANIVVSGNNCFLVDLGSGNGTYLNGVKLSPNKQSILRHGDMISIENFNLNFNMIDEMLASSFNEVTDSDILEVKLLKKVLKAIDKERVPSIEVLNGNFVGKKYFFADDVEEITIGREDNCEFQIEEYVISRAHARITREGEGMFVQDLGSKNGTYINNRRVTKEELHDGDRIAFGTIVLIFRNPNDVKMEDISVKARKIDVGPAPKTRPRPESTDDELEVARPEQEGDDLTAEGSDYEPFGEAPDAITPDDHYPTPRPRREKIRLSVFEMGMIGIGIVVFIFAIISFVNLISK